MRDKRVEGRGGWVGGDRGVGFMETYFLGIENEAELLFTSICAIKMNY